MLLAHTYEPDAKTESSCHSILSIAFRCQVIQLPMEQRCLLHLQLKGPLEKTFDGEREMQQQHLTSKGVVEMLPSVYI